MHNGGLCIVDGMTDPYLPDGTTQADIDRAAGGYDEPECSCVNCHLCNGCGLLYFDENGRCVAEPVNDLFAGDKCPNCRGSGIEELCETCANEPVEEDL